MRRLTPTTTRMRSTARPRRPAAADRLAMPPGGATTDHGPSRGFTLVELLVVITILAILVALLLPAINGAVRTARNAAVSAEINQLATALADFKSRYGDYPPSRILLAENGDFSGNGLGIGVNSPVSGFAGYPGFGYPGSSATQPEITVSQLAARSMMYLRKFFPKVVLRNDGTPVFPTGSSAWYDFNGDGVMETVPYILQGHECLVFFLGGIPLQELDSNGNPTGQFSMTGFGRDPANPFSNSIASDPNYGGGPNPMYNPNRQPPLFEFNAGRLYLDPNRANPIQRPRSGYRVCNIPGYVDSLGNAPPGTGTSLNFYAYFSAYGNGNYDPNDVNFPEHDPPGAGSPIGLRYTVGFPVYVGRTLTQPDASPSPNPYTTTLTVPPTGTVGYQNPQTFQIISSGADGLYGVGGQYVSNTASSANISVPYDGRTLSDGSPVTVNTTDPGVRQREYDNITNFKSGTLQ